MDLYQQYIAKSKYARYLDHEKRREHWPETVARYFDFMTKHLYEKHQYSIAPTLLNQLEQAVLNLEVMPSMRALMTAGPALARQPLCGFNPVVGSTKVLTREFGVVPIETLKDKAATVLNVEGRWAEASFKCYGEQPLLSVEFKQNSKHSRKVTCSLNHRWVLKNGEVKAASDLRKGDRIDLIVAPRPEEDSDYLLGVRHGLVYGDGSAVKSCARVRGYRIRLCGKNKELLRFFSNYPVSYPPSCNGDPIVHLFDTFAHTHSLKELPGADETSSYLLGFVRGWFAADGHTAKSAQSRLCCNQAGADWLFQNAERIGWIPTCCHEQPPVTNYGHRRYRSFNVSFNSRAFVPDDFIASWHRVNFENKVFSNTKPNCFVVSAVEALNRKELVYCAEVPDTNTFVLQGGLVTGNCAYIAMDDQKAFDELLYCLMCGCGVGFSVERQQVNKLPDVPDRLFESDTTVVVSDSKEGWAKGLRQIIALLYSGEIPKWDLSKVRPAGKRLKTFGGRSSGPEPLNSLFHFIVKVFVKAQGSKLTSLQVHDICCKIAEVVVVGGVRRAALISLSNLSDERMRKAKSGEWWQTQGQRSLANNSAVYTERPEVGVFMQEWLSLYESKSGERGIFNRQAAERSAAKSGRRKPYQGWGANPCVAGDTIVKTTKGLFSIESLRENPFTALINGIPVDVPGGSFVSGYKMLYRLSLETGEEVKLTKDHKVRVYKGLGVWAWKQAGSLTADDYVCLDDSYMRNNYDSYTTSNFKSLVELGMDYVWDMQVPDANRFSANGIIVHNCGEIVLRSMETCNLTEVVVRPEDTEHDLLVKVQLATILGTFQSTLTDFAYLRKQWKTNAEEERLLGVSLTGICDNKLTSNKDEEALEKLLTTLRESAIMTNFVTADLLGINPSVAITTTKPSGTVSQLVSCSSGIHPTHADYYIRRVRNDNKDPLTQFMKDAGIPNEPCAMRPESTTIFSFPIKAAENALTRKDMTAEEHFKLWLSYKKHYTEHNPSVTISVREKEWPKMGALVWDNFDDILGVSFLPFNDEDHSYVQAPYEEITKEQYEQLLAQMPKEINWDDLVEHEDNVEGTQTLACQGGFCEI